MTDLLLLMLLIVILLIFVAVYNRILFIRFVVLVLLCVEALNLCIVLFFVPNSTSYGADGISNSVLKKIACFIVGVLRICL